MIDPSSILNGLIAGGILLILKSLRRKAVNSETFLHMRQAFVVWCAPLVERAKPRSGYERFLYALGGVAVLALLVGLGFEAATGTAPVAAQIVLTLFYVYIFGVLAKRGGAGLFFRVRKCRNRR